MSDHDCGPEGSDADFFREIEPLFAKHPEAARKYVIRCVDHETDIMKVDFSKMEGRARIIGNVVVTEFVDKTVTDLAPTICCQWEHTGPAGGGVWTCTQRWA